MVWLRRLSVLLPCVGLFVAGYLSIYHLLDLDASCGPQHGCSAVSTWVDQNLGGFPIAYLGLAGYILLILVGIMGIVQKKVQVKTGLMLSGIGTLASAALMVISFFVIKATCWWCVGSALTMLATFGVYLTLKMATSDGNTEWKSDGTDFGLTAFGILGALLGLTYITMEQALPLLPPHAPGDINDYISKSPKAYGKPDAPIAIVEFFSFTCPHCRESFAPMKDLVDASNGKARLVMLHFPFIGREDHAMSAPAAAVSEMAHEKGKFFEYANKIFSYDTKALDIPKIIDAGVSVGLDEATIKKRLSDSGDVIFLRVTDDLNVASKLGVELTPTYLVGRPGTGKVDVLTMRKVIPTVTGVRYGLPKPDSME